MLRSKTCSAWSVCVDEHLSHADCKFNCAWIYLGGRLHHAASVHNFTVKVRGGYITPILANKIPLELYRTAFYKYIIFFCIWHTMRTQQVIIWRLLNNDNGRCQFPGFIVYAWFVIICRHSFIFSWYNCQCNKLKDLSNSYPCKFYTPNFLLQVNFTATSYIIISCKTHKY